MEPPDILDRLLKVEILNQENESLNLSKNFQHELEIIQSIVENQSNTGITDQISTWIETEYQVQSLLKIANEWPKFVSLYCILSKTFPSSDHDEVIQLAIILNQLQSSSYHIEGAPNTFFPIQGDQLPLLLHFYPHSIVYIWRGDCEPCNVVKETLEDLIEEPPNEIALFAIYGPNCSRFLYEEYNVVGGPATLFIFDKEIDSRVYGASYPETFKHELEYLEERVQDS